MKRTALITPQQRGANADRLNAQQQVFVAEILARGDFNATEAAKKAGYKAPSQAANQLLKHKIISAILGKAMYDREQRLQITADRVMAELGHIAFANAQSYYNADGSLKPLQDLTPQEAAAIKEIESETEYRKDGDEVVPTVVTKYKFHDKIKALELIGRNLSIFNEKVQHEFSGGVQLDFVSLVKKLEDRRSNVIDGEVIRKEAE